MFHDESRKSVYFGVKRTKFKITSHENIAGVGHCTLVSVFNLISPIELLVDRQTNKIMSQLPDNKRNEERLDVDENSSGDEIANVNFFTTIWHVRSSKY